MATVKVLDLNNSPVGEIELSDNVFNVEVNEALLYEAKKWQLACRRQGTASTKTRKDVKFATRKLFRQKGTGRARRGSLKSPVLRGGGTVFGPHPRDYSYTLPRKVRQGALRSALSARFQNNGLVVLDGFELSEIKTKAVVGVLETLGLKNALVVDGDNLSLHKSMRNLPRADYLHVNGVNVYDILNHDTLVLTKRAVEVIEGRLG